MAGLVSSRDASHEEILAWALTERGGIGWRIYR
jgi:hypothetical protein